MKKRRFRFSLRTLLLATLFAGSVMLVWRVREPWELRAVKWVKPSERSVLQSLDVSCDGNYAVLGMGSAAGSREVTDGYFVADLRDGNIVYHSAHYLSWHPVENLILDGRNVLQFPGATVHFRGAGNLKFSAGGRFLIDAEADVLTFYDANSTQRISTCAVSDVDKIETNPGDSSALVAVKTKSNSNVKDEYCIDCFEIASGRRIWRFPLPERCLPMYLCFDSGEISVYGTATDFALADYFMFALDAATGKVFRESKNLGDIPPRRKLMTRRFGSNSIRVPVETTLSTCDLHSPQTVIELPTSGAHVHGPIAFAGNMQRAACAVGTNSLGIWTRRRQHFEWWGLYEQWETWLAAAFLFAFGWSLRIDWLDARKTALVSKSISA